MTRLILVAAFVSATVLAFAQPPMESALGLNPVPEPEKMTGSSPASEIPLDFWKYAITQGGLTLVCLVLFWWITREHKRQDAVKDERQQILVTLVEKNTTALVNSEATHARLARAIENRGLVPPGSSA